MESPRADERAQPLARRGGFQPSAACGLGPAPQAQLHHPAEIAAAELRIVLNPRRRAPGRLSPLPRQRAARGVRSARHADPPHAAGKGKSLRAALVPRTRSSHSRAGSPIANFGFKRGTSKYMFLVRFWI